MLPRGRSAAISILAVLAAGVPACGEGVDASPAASTSTMQAAGATPEPTPVAPESTSPTPVATETPDLRLGVERLERHLVSLQRIAASHGGHRVTASEGYEAAAAYARTVLEDAGYDVHLRPFSIDGFAGTNLLVERIGASDEVVMLGAHLDTVAGSPGMNDNASGVAAVLAIAETVAELPEPHRSIRMALWDAEEGGPFGSRAYVATLPADELAQIRAYLNLDMIGSPNPLRLVYAEAGAADGSAAITDRFASALEDAGLTWEPIDLDGDSDHGPFRVAGIPTGGLFSGGIEPVTDAQAARFRANPGVPADPCSHRPCDTIDNVDVGAATELAGVAATVLLALAHQAD